MDMKYRTGDEYDIIHRQCNDLLAEIEKYANYYFVY